MNVTLNPKEKEMLERIKAYDMKTYNHSVHVGEMSKEFSSYLVNQSNVSDKRGFVERVYNAAVVHDAGKLMIPYEIINKPGNLTNAEFSLISKHAENAHDVLNGFPETDIQVATQHHYNFNTREMSLEAQIVAVCDVYSAITLERSYSPAHPPAYAINEILTNPGCLNKELINFYDDFLRENKYYEQGLPISYQPPTYEDYMQHSLYYLSSKYSLSSDFMQTLHYKNNDFIVYEKQVIGVLKADGTIEQEPHESELLMDREHLFEHEIDWTKYEDPTIPEVDEYEAEINES